MTRWARISFSLATLFATVFVGASELAAQTDLDLLVDSIVAESPPPGRKDIEATLEPFAIGPALWDTGEVRGGYNGKLPELVLDGTSPNYEFMEDVPAIDGGPTTLIEVPTSSTDPVNAIDPPIFPMLFELPFSRFSFEGDAEGTLPDEGDYAAVLETGSNFFAVQNTIFSPIVGGCGTTACMTFLPFDELTGALGPLAAGDALRYAQNIGFANHPAFAAGHYEFAVQYPLITKFDVLEPLPSFAKPRPGVPTVQLPGYTTAHLPPMLGTPPDLHYGAFGIPFDPLFAGEIDDPDLPADFPEEFADTTEKFRNVSMSMVHPEVAQLLEEAIADRVRPPGTDAFADGLDYNAICGEYFIATAGSIQPFNFDVPAFEPPPNIDLSKVPVYRALLPDTDYSRHSYEHFRAWLERRYEGDLAALAVAWGWPPVQACVDDEKSFAECDALDPLLDNDVQAAKLAGANLPVIFTDWVAFQYDQFVESQAFQYRAAVRAAAEKTTARVGDMDLVDDGNYVLHFNLEGIDHGALLSDGVALGNWHGLDAATRRADRFSPMKQRALHAISYGESLNFPLFGMPRDLDLKDSFCESSDQEGKIPDEFRPACLDFDYSMRTLREFLALGVDSLGVAYWENVALWTTADSVFQPVFEPPVAIGPDSGLNTGVVTGSGTGTTGGGPMVDLDLADFPLRAGISIESASMTSIANSQTTAAAGFAGSTILDVMTAEVASLRTRRAFMTPWRSPLLVHTGDAVDRRAIGPDKTPYDTAVPTGVRGLTVHALESLSAEHAQFAPFTVREGFDDLWLTSERELLLSPFVPDLDVELLERYQEAADDHGWDLLVLTDMDTFGDLVNELLLVPGACDPDATPLCERAVIKDEFGIVWDLLGFHVDTTADKVSTAAYVEDELFAMVEARTETTVRPVSITGPEVCGGALVEPADVDLSVMTDGLNFLVTATNTNPAQQSFHAVADAEISGTALVDDSPTTDFCLLDTVDSEVHFLRPPPTYFSAISVSEIDASLIDAESKRIALTLAGFDTRAAEVVLDELEFIRLEETDFDVMIAKITAGLLRLERMPFLRFDPLTDELAVASFDFLAIPGARVQIEFPLQLHARRDAAPLSGDPLVTNAGGKLVLDDALDPYGTHVADDGDGRVWDFVSKSYTRPDPIAGDEHIVRVEVRHPVYGSQAALVIDVPDEPCQLDPLWTNLGFALAGGLGEPVLDGFGTLSTSGPPSTLSVTNANPNSSAILIVGSSILLAPFNGGTLVPSPDMSVALMTDATGSLSFDFQPAGTPVACPPVYFQVWISDAAGPQGFSATNGLSGIVDSCDC